MKLKYICILVVICILCTWSGMLRWIRYYKNENRDFSCIVTGEDISEIDGMITRKYTLNMENIFTHKLHLVKIFFGLPVNYSSLDAPPQISLYNFSPLWWKHHWFEVGDAWLSLTHTVTYTQQGNMYKTGGTFFLEYVKWNKTLRQKCEEDTR